MNFPAVFKRPISSYLSPTFQNHRFEAHQSSSNRLPLGFIRSSNANIRFKDFSLVTSSRTEFQLNILSHRLPGVRASSNDAQSIACGSFGAGGEVREPTFMEFITSERVKVVAMLALALALCNADRVVMSVAIVPLSMSYGWRQSFAGVVQVSLCFRHFWYQILAQLVCAISQIYLYLNQSPIKYGTSIIFVKGFSNLK